MKSLFLQFSILIGALTLANRMAIEATPVDAVLAALGAAAAMYIVLVGGDFVVQRALDYAAPVTTPVTEGAIEQAPQETESQSHSVDRPNALAA